MNPEIFPCSVVAGGQVSRVGPDSTGLNPAWRKSLALAIIFTAWQDGANLTEIEATRQLLIEDMKILEGIAPESGAYLNEVRVPRLFTVLRLSYLKKTPRRVYVGVEI